MGAVETGVSDEEQIGLDCLLKRIKEAMQIDEDRDGGHEKEDGWWHRWFLDDWFSGQQNQWLILW